MVKLVEIIDLSLQDVFERIENLPMGKTIYFHDLSDFDLSIIMKNFKDNKSYKLSSTNDTYSKLFDERNKTQKYQLRVDNWGED